MKQHEAWILRIAKSYLRRGYELEDLVQQGTIGFLKAFRKWSPEGGASLLGFSRVYVQCEIRNMIGERDGELRKEEHHESLDDGSTLLGDRSEESKATHADQTAAEAFAATGSKTPEDLAIDNERSAALRGAINGLPEAHRRVMVLAIDSDEFSDEAIAEKINRSRPRVQQIRTAAVEELRERLTGAARAS